MVTGGTIWQSPLYISRRLRLTSHSCAARSSHILVDHVVVFHNLILMCRRGQVGLLMFKISKSLCTNLPTAAAAAWQWATNPSSSLAASFLSQRSFKQERYTSPLHWVWPAASEGQLKKHNLIGFTHLLFKQR